MTKKLNVSNCTALPGEALSCFKDLERGKNSLIKTANQMGYMATDIDMYTQKFIDECKPGGTYLEIGCSYGLALLKMLEKGGKIIANDIEETHLRYLKDLIKEHYPSHLPNLNTLLGRFPEEINFLPNSLNGVLAARVFHFLEGEEIEKGCQHIYKWLKPGGKLYIVSETPYRDCLANFIPIYEDKKNKGSPWPGMLRNVDQYFPNTEDLPSFINFLDKDDVAKMLKKCGFKIEIATNFKRFIGSEPLFKDKPNFMAVIATKPS